MYFIQVEDRNDSGRLYWAVQGAKVRDNWLCTGSDDGAAYLMEQLQAAFDADRGQPDTCTLPGCSATAPCSGECWYVPDFHALVTEEEPPVHGEENYRTYDVIGLL